LPDLAVALSVILEREDHSFVLPRIESHPALRRFAGLAHSVLALRLALGERSLATLVLIDKRPTPVSPTRRFTPDDMQLALALAPQASLLLDHARLHRGLYAALRDAVATLSSAMGARDEYTSGHSARVARYAVFLADRMGLPQWCLEAVELGALLHDIGKIAMDEVVLRGARTLTAADRLLVHQHPVTGASIFSHMDELAALLPAIRHHHERYDGTGYPDGLAGDRIPLLARVVGIADSFDAMTFRRPYRERALTFEEACEELRTNAGLQFDPELVDVFVEHATSDLVFETRRGGRRQTVGIRTGDTGELLLREAQTVPIRVDSDDLRRTAL
jgi:putative nucleotidyltransferase with HDIG domain